MNLNPFTVHKLKTLFVICFFSILAGVGYQYFTEGSISYHGPMVGLFIGSSFYIIEIFLLNKLNNYLETLPILITLITKSLECTIVIYIVSNTFILFFNYLDGIKAEDLFRYISSTGYLYSRGQLRVILYSLGIFTVLNFFMQLRTLMGRNVLWRFLMGKYIRPVEEERIFMFLDLKSSTTIAESMGHKKYYAFLNSCYHEITAPVLMTKAEIYQYVGDEVVFTWKMKDGLKKANCIRIFFMIKKNISKNSGHYLKEYGTVPEFKAGLHFGKVIIGQIGEIKKEIVYNGDVLNTTSRIQNLCGSYRQELLVSKPLVEILNLPEYFSPEYLGKAELRGRKEEIELYTIENKNHGLSVQPSGAGVRQV